MFGGRERTFGESRKPIVLKTAHTCRNPHDATERAFRTSRASRDVEVQERNRPVRVQEGKAVRLRRMGTDCQS